MHLSGHCREWETYPRTAWQGVGGTSRSVIQGTRGISIRTWQGAGGLSDDALEGIGAFSERSLHGVVTFRRGLCREQRRTLPWSTGRFRGISWWSLDAAGDTSDKACKRRRKSLRMRRKN